jgi:RNA polymerase sigma-70 factor, ECF subfamily
VAIPDPDREAQALVRVARGDHAAASICVDAFAPMVQALARRMLNSANDVDDAVQDVFIELWKFAHRFDPRVASARAFVAVITRRRLIDRVRTDRARLNLGGRSVNQPESMDTITGLRPFLTALESARLSDTLQEATLAMGSLADDQQEAIRLSIGQGWTHQRIADHLGMPLGTVKSNIRRGLLRLREALEPDEPSLADRPATDLGSSPPTERQGGKR